MKIGRLLVVRLAWAIEIPPSVHHGRHVLDRSADLYSNQGSKCKVWPYHGFEGLTNSTLVE